MLLRLPQSRKLPKQKQFIDLKETSKEVHHKSIKTENINTN